MPEARPRRGAGPPGEVVLAVARSDGHRHRAAAVGRVDGLAVVLGQAAPDAVRLTDGESVLAALAHHRAGGAHTLGGRVAVAAGRPPHPLEEGGNGGVGIPADVPREY